MPVISYWDFSDPGIIVDDDETANGAQNGFYQQGAVSVGGEAVLDGCGAYVKLSQNETFQMDQGTLAIEFTLGTDPLTDTQTVLSRDSSGSNEGSFRVEILADGAVVVSQETATGTETYTTGPGFANPGDTVSLSYSWDAGAGGGALVIDNTTTGGAFDATVPADTTLDMGSLSPHWVIGAGQENSPSGSITGLDQSFQGTVEYFSLSDTVDNLPTPDGYVDGTAGDDLIDLAYTGDPNGDRIDNDDALLPGDAPDDDRVRAGEGDDTVVAGEGDDSVEGGTGADRLSGGIGDDTLLGEDGDDTLIGEDGDDSITGGNGNDAADGGDGDDVINTSGGGHVPLPDQGYPGLYPSDAAPLNDLDTVFGGAGGDTITTGDDADVIFGGADDDVIDAGFDDDTVSGGTGDDTVIGAEGADSIDAGEGNDLVYGGYDPSVPDAVNIPDATDALPLNANDSIRGGAGTDTIFGMDDDDTIDGGADADLIDGGIDEDLVTGGAGNDTITGGQGADTLAGGADRDLFTGSTAGDDVDGNEGGNDFDTLDLTGAGPLRVNYDPANAENGTVDFLDADRNVTGTMTFVNIENVVPCFTPGTMIATPKGEVAAELLKVGDRIITRDNGIQEIRWTGAKALSWADLHLNPHLKPVLIRQGSLGNGLPERDMLVSPNHRMLVANDRTALYFDEHEVLVAAKHLISGQGIHSVDSAGTTYLHFMFDRHEVVLANGAWTESFQPGDFTLKGMGNAQRSEIFDLFPDLKTDAGLEGYTAARKTLKRHEALLLVK